MVLLPAAVDGLTWIGEISRFAVGAASPETLLAAMASSRYSPGLARHHPTHPFGTTTHSPALMVFATPVASLVIVTVPALTNTSSSSGWFGKRTPTPDVS